MYGFSGSGSVGADSKEGDRSVSGRSSAGVGAGASASASTAGMSRSSTPSSRNAAGRESTASRAGADSKEGDRSLSAGVDPSRFGGRSLNATSTPTGMRAGDVGAVNRENDRSLSTGVDPSRFGGPATGFNTSTPTGMRVGGNGVVGADAREGDRSLSTGIDPSRFGSTTRGFGYATAFGDDREIDRSLATPSFQSFRSTDLAEMRRAQEDKSMDTYRDMVAANTQRQIGQYQTAQDNMLAVGIGDVGGKLGLTDAFLGPIVDHMIGVESANNPTAKNPVSSATGLGQFISSTWVGMINKYRPDLANLTRQEKLALRTDPALSREMTTNYATENAVHLSKNGIEVTPRSIYAAHFLGPDGAVKAFRANPQSSAKSVLGADAVAANKNIMQGRTIGQVLGYIDKHMTMDAPKTITNHPIAGTFASKYLGGSQPGPEFGRVGTITGVSPEDAYLGPQSGISDDESGKNIAMWEQRQKEAAVPGGVEEVTTTSPGTDAGAPPVKERSIVGSLIGGGVDVLTSLNPLTAGVNFLTQLVTGKSLGDHIADGDNQYDGTIKGDSGSRGDRNVPKQAEIKKPGSTVNSATFADKYLADTGFSDPVKRPTPAQKWGEGSLPAEYGKSEYA